MIEQNRKVVETVQLSDSPKKTARVSVSSPLNPDATFRPSDQLKVVPLSRPRATPDWMRLLPSRVNPEIHPPRHSVLERSPSFPFIEHTRYSTPFSTPPEFPRSQSLQAVDLVRALSHFSRPPVPHTIPTQSPKAKKKHLARRASAPNPHRRPLAVPRLSPMPEVDTPAPSLSTQPAIAVPTSLPPTPPATPPPNRISRSTSISQTGMTKHDLKESAAHTRALRRRLSKPTKTPSSAMTSDSGNASTNVQTKIRYLKPSFVRELFGFFASREGK